MKCCIINTIVVLCSRIFLLFKDGLTLNFIEMEEADVEYEEESIEIFEAKEETLVESNNTYKTIM